MKVTPIRSPLPGERVVGVHPTMRPLIETDWRRLNLYTGRALSDLALTTEQKGRAGRLALRGQMVSHGVVVGLELDLEPAATEEDGADTLYLTPGLGLAASGEDVHVLQPQRVALGELPVYAPAALLAEGSGETAGEPVEGGSGALLARRMGPPLRELLERGVALPRAAVLVLQPIVAEMIGNPDPTDPCEQDPESYAFDDWQLADGARPVLYAWPGEWAPLPEPDQRWRNRIAYTIFAREAQLEAGEILPWEALGLPVGLVGFAADFTASFVDRYAVVRAGGRPRPRRSPVPGAGSARLWRARIEQLSEQLSEAERDGVSLDDAAGQLRYLPPAGLLPRDAVDLETRRTRFFPGSFYLDAVPVPLEQLELAFEASASLRPFDTFTADRVRVLVPVPQPWYEPRLLQTEEIDPAFQEAIDRYTAERAEGLQRRGDVRLKSSALLRAISGEPPEYADPDPDALEEEEVRSAELDPPEDAYGTSVVLDDSGEPVLDESGEPLLRIDALEALRGRLGESSPLGEDELAELDARGLEGFIGFLDEKIRRANDRIDFGFLRVQADIYRIRQLVLGTTAATRLATSPALAAIVKGDSAVATRDDLRSFLETAKGRPMEPPEGPAAPTTPSPTGTTPAGGPGGAGGPVFHHAAVAMSAELSAPAAAGTSPVEIGRIGIGSGGIRDIGGIVGGGGLIGGGGGIVGGGGTGGGVFERGEIVGGISGAGPQLERGGLISEGALFQTRPITKETIFGQSPIVGADFDFRTVTVTERLQAPPAPETKNFTVANRFEVVSELVDVGIRLDDIRVPGVPERDEQGNPVFDERTGLPRRRDVPLGEIGDLGELLRDPDPRDGDEATFFGVATNLLDHTTTLLRRVEGRVQAYRNALADCQKTLQLLRSLLTRADRRLKEIGDRLAEARHDVAVARALLAEEQERIDGINERRRQILAEHVRFLAFQRPRLTHALLTDAPVRSLNPDVSELPPPACLVRPVEPPAELRAMVELLRQAPVRWFTQVPQLLGRLDRLDVLHGAVVGAKQRAQLQEQSVAPALPPASGLLGNAIARLFSAQQTVVEQQRLQAAQLDLSRFVGQSWLSSKNQAEQVVSLGDLIDARHGQVVVNRAAARELEQILRTATCLYVRFGDVLPGLRLLWAERLSQHDQPVDLRNLYVLPRWGEIPFLDRRELQMLVDWLYGRVNPQQPEAVAMLSDVVRVCLLLASHAPVNRIIGGRLARPTTLKLGGRLELAVDLTRVHVGMQVLVYSGNQTVGRGVVEDLSAGQAAARVVQALQEGIELPEGARVQFTEPGAEAAMSVGIGGLLR